MDMQLNTIKDYNAGCTGTFQVVPVNADTLFCARKDTWAEIERLYTEFKTNMFALHKEKVIDFVRFQKQVPETGITEFYFLARLHV